MHRALLGNGGDGDAGGRDGLVCGDDGSISGGLRGDEGLFDGLSGDELLVGDSLPCLGLRKRDFGFGDLLLGLLLTGEVTEGEYGTESAGFAKGLIGRSEVHAGLLGHVGGLDGDERETLRFRSGVGGVGLRLGGGDLGGVGELLQFVDLGRGFGETRAERRGILISVSVGRGGGDGHDSVAILT